MFTAASVMNKVCGCPGTSMTKTWLMRRPVRIPVSRFTTSASNSSVCKLPFISSSALPVRTSSTAFSAAAWLCGTSMISKPPRSREKDWATLRILSFGPTRIGLMSFLGRLERAFKRRLVTWMRHGGRKGGLLLRRCDQAIVFFVLPRRGRDLGHHVSSKMLADDGKRVIAAFSRALV